MEFYNEKFIVSIESITKLISDYTQREASYRARASEHHNHTEEERKTHDCAGCESFCNREAEKCRIYIEQLEILKKDLEDQKKSIDEADEYLANLFYTDEQLAAREAGLLSDLGQICINSAYDYKLFKEKLDVIKNKKSFIAIDVYNCFTNGEYNAISSQSPSNNILTYEHQYFLDALTIDYDNKYYYEEKGYIIDAYLLMGICFGESNANKNSENPFGSVGKLSDSQIQTANQRAIEALVSSNIADNAYEAQKILDKDSFYQNAADVLSYLDNGKKYNVELSNNYESIPQVMPNVERWREAVKSNSVEVSDYAYYYYN